MTESPVRKRPTQDDVARRAGVSQSVVSLVLNNRPLVAITPETRQRVLAAIDELGYVPDGAARSLRTRKTRTIASLIPDIANPFYPAFERGIQDVADAHGYVLSAFNTDGVREKELRCIQSARQARIDGLIATPFQLTADDFAPLIDSGAPAVVFGEITDASAEPDFDCLYVDDYAAASRLVAYLVERAYRPIAMIASGGEIRRRKGRVLAYREAMARRQPAQAPIFAYGKDPTEEGGYTAMRDLLRRAERPRAVFADNDMMAVGAMVAIREAGLRVPDDIAIAGFDDVVVARWLNPPLTTVAQFPERLGRRAAELLFERLEGGVDGPGRRVEMPYEVMIRASA
jgi:LacI family transcriptional regulator, galactose operon repressor